MSTNAKAAVVCFSENLQDYVNPQTNGEKHNLYMGLLSMAQELEALSSHAHRLDDKLDQLIQALNRSR